MTVQAFLRAYLDTFLKALDLTETRIPSEINQPLKMSMKSRIIEVLHWLVPGTFEIA